MNYALLRFIKFEDLVGIDNIDELNDLMCDEVVCGNKVMYLL